MSEIITYLLTYFQGVANCNFFIVFSLFFIFFLLSVLFLLFIFFLLCAFLLFLYFLSIIIVHLLFFLLRVQPIFCTQTNVSIRCVILGYNIEIIRLHHCSVALLSYYKCVNKRNSADW